MRDNLATFADLLGDPDEGLVLREDLAEELQRSLAEIGTGEQTLSMLEVVSRLKLNK